MTQRRFHTLDVFTDQALAGNPLAVVHDCEGLDENAMQAIAAEFNLSETVFVMPPDNPDHAARIRIFTPVHELPFAGHPTVGTAILLSKLRSMDDGAELVLEENVGPVVCRISDANANRTARFGLPRVSQPVDWTFDSGLVAESIGLKESDLGFDNHTLSLWNGGVPYTMVPVRSIECVRQVSLDTAKLAQVEPVVDGLAANLYVYCRGGEGADAAFHARMFAPLWGIPEDPATGSAVASFSGQIAACEMAGDETATFLIEQGYEMGRPSQIHLDITRTGGETADAVISGAAVLVSEGMLQI